MHITKAQIKLFRSLRQKKFRDENRLFLAEGRKCVEALFARFRRGFVVVKEDAVLENIPQGILLLEASGKEMEQLSQLQTSPDVLAVFAVPDGQMSVEQCLMLAKSGLVLVLDEVQDPGNLGTIVRTADWFGVRHIVCSPATADVFNGKVVQATMGSLARVEVHYADLDRFLSAAQEASLPVYGTLLDGENIYSCSLSSFGIVMMGNEGKGISASLRRYITAPLFIPSFPSGQPTAESLNVAVATAVVLAEFRRRM